MLEIIPERYRTEIQIEKLRSVHFVLVSRFFFRVSSYLAVAKLYNFL